MVSARRVPCAVLALALLSLPARANAQQPSSASVTPAVAADDGIPVRSELVRAKCGGCHRPDDQQRMSRISYRRASPENWELTIKRMMTLNNVTLEPGEARAILKYLADHHGLAPDEAQPVAFEAERRLIDFKYTADADTQGICTVCHSVGRVMSERRTKEEWALLLSMHRGYYPGVDNQPMMNGQGFRRNRPLETPAGPDGRPPDTRHPMDKVVDHLAVAFPLQTRGGRGPLPSNPPALRDDGGSRDMLPARGRSSGKSSSPRTAPRPTASARRPPTRSSDRRSPSPSRAPRPSTPDSSGGGGRPPRPPRVRSGER